jgi:hypothetical protein
MRSVIGGTLFIPGAEKHVEIGNRVDKEEMVGEKIRDHAQ